MALTPEIPEGVAWGVIVANVGAILSDGPDAGRVPDLAGYSGEIVITAAEADAEWVQFGGTTPSGLFHVDELVCPVIGGVMYPPGTDPDALPPEPGVPTIATPQPLGIPNIIQRRAVFRLDLPAGVAQPWDRVFNVPAGGADAIVDLATELGVEPEVPLAIVTSAADRVRAEAAASIAAQAETTSVEARDITVAAAETALAGGRLLGALMRPFSIAPHPTAQFRLIGPTEEEKTAEFGPNTAIPWNSGRITFYGGQPTANPGGGCLTKPTGADNEQSTFMTFYTNASKLGFQGLVYEATDLTVYVNRMPVEVDVHVIPTVGAPIAVIDGLPAGVHEVTAVVGRKAAFVQLIASSTAQFWAAPAPEFRVALPGDSYWDAAATQGPYHGGFVRELHRLTGWACFGLGQGGTGYTNPGATPGFQVYGGSERMAALEAADPHLVVPDGSVNDGGALPAALTTAVTDYFDALPAPAVGLPLQPLGEGGSVAINNAIIAGMRASSNLLGVIDWFTKNWITGTGHEGAPTGDGNQDWFVGTDGVHLNHWGNRHIAPLIVDELRAIPAPVRAPSAA